MAPVSAPAKVLVSGVNGYLGAWTVRKFLEAGYSVRGTVRSVTKSGPHLQSLFGSYGDKFELVEVKDITAAGAFDEAVKGVDVVAHTASPFNQETDPEKVIPPALEGTTRILESTKEHGSSVKRFVLLSSIVSMLKPQAVLDDTLWNDPAVENVKKNGAGAGAWDVYCASKTLSERAAWEFVEKHKSEISWDMVSLNPPFLYGPAIHEVSSVSGLNESLAKLYDTVVARTRSNDRLANEFQISFDVRDTASLIVDATSNPKVSGERYMLGYGPIWDQQIVDVALKLQPPPLTTPLTEGVPGGTDSKAHMFKLDVSKADKAFGFKWTPLEDSVRDTLLFFKEKGFVA